MLEALTPEQLATVRRRSEELTASGKGPWERAGEVHPDGRVRDRYGRLPRRKRNLTASVDPELHEAATAAIQASGLGVSAWLAEAIALKLAVKELGDRGAAVSRP
jgi:hypothetical protein